MRMTRARRALVPAVLAVSLAIALAVPSQSTVHSAPAAHHATHTSSASARDDGRRVAAAPTTGPEWLANQLRGTSGVEQQCAVLLVAAALVVARRWRRAATQASIGRGPLRTSWSASRAPPAFA
jgi:hypothetical protein